MNKKSVGGLNDFTLSIDGDGNGEWGYFQKKVLVWTLTLVVK